MTIRIILQNGNIEKIEDVKRIEVDKENGKRITIYREHYTTKMPCCDFKSIVILND